jgi:predicted acetyltransferase
MDLVAEIHLGDLLDEDPMPLMIDDARRVHTQGILDGLWLRVLDPVAALGSRRYATSDRLVVAVGERRFHLETALEAVHCEELESRGHDSVDIDIDPVLLGAWLIGPVDLPRWLAAGQIRVRDAAMRDRLAALVASVHPPVCTTHF